MYYIIITASTSRTHVLNEHTTIDKFFHATLGTQVGFSH